MDHKLALSKNHLLHYFWLSFLSQGELGLVHSFSHGLLPAWFSTVVRSVVVVTNEGAVSITIGPVDMGQDASDLGELINECHVLEVMRLGAEST